MTQQYLVGELSELLGLLEVSVPGGGSSARRVARLRREAENRGPAGLAGMAVRAVAMADALCWEALGRGDVAAFAREAEVAAELQRFGVCAGLLDEG